MSNDLVPEAWKTKLKSPAAKTVLALLAEAANSDGFGFPSIQYVCNRTELSKRQVQRVIQVFQEIGLIEKGPGGMGPRGPYQYSFQINTEMLSTDLSVTYRAAFQRAQGKGKSVSETVTQPVSETRKGVSETRKGVSETLPPHPLYGGTVRNRKEPPAPPGGSGGLFVPHPAIVNEIVDEVMRGCGVSNRRRRPAIADAVMLALGEGESPQTLAAAMIAAWQLQASMNAQGLLRVVYGLDRFLDGVWRKQETWHWNHGALAKQRQSAVGVGTFEVTPTERVSIADSMSPEWCAKARQRQSEGAMLSDLEKGYLREVKQDTQQKPLAKDREARDGVR